MTSVYPSVIRTVHRLIHKVEQILLDCEEVLYGCIHMEVYVYVLG